VITVEDHLGRILAETQALGSETLPLAEAVGRCLTEPVLARNPVPPWTNSAMDGYAVRHEDVAAAGAGDPVGLKVVADIPAGSGRVPDLGPGETARIMTGAPVPPGADTVVPQELTDQGEGVVRIFEAPAAGRHVRHAGEDRETGERIAGSGTVLTPETLASIASAGAGEVTVAVLPRVAVISTGDELVDPGDSLAPGQIPDSNGLLVSLIARESGASVSTDRAGDAPGELGRVIDRHAGESDVLVLTGGVSVGAFDPVKTLFEGGDSVRFDRVAMQPGKPQAFGRIGDAGPLVFGLPGNPVSAWVSFQMFVRPALRKMQGLDALVPDPVPARAGEDWKTPEGRAQVIPVRINDTAAGREVRPAASGGSGSHLIASLAGADGYALVDAAVDAVRAGDRVLTVRLRDPEQFNHQRSRP